MEGFVIAAVVVAWFCSLVCCVIKAEHSETPLFWLGFGVVILCSGLGFVIQQEIYEQKEGPCLAYEEASRLSSENATIFLQGLKEFYGEG